VRERQGQDLGWLRPPGRDEPGDPARDDLRLAGPRPGYDEQRPGGMRDGAQLVGIQPTKQRLETRRRLDRRRWRHDRDELAPGRQLVERRGLASASDARSR